MLSCHLQQDTPQWHPPLTPGHNRPPSPSGTSPLCRLLLGFHRHGGACTCGSGCLPPSQRYKQACEPTARQRPQVMVHQACSSTAARQQWSPPCFPLPPMQLCPDVRYNEVFKAKMCTQFNEWLLAQNPNKTIRRATRHDLSEWIITAQANVSAVTIPNAWKKTGFSYYPNQPRE
jgi:hypothetical protein